jgi:hypothetical protein
MVTQLKNLSKLRKLHLAYNLLTSGINVFLIAITITLISGLFGDEGLILKDYIVPFLGLSVFLPKICRYIINNPIRSYKYVVAIEMVCIAGYGIADAGYYPEIVAVTSMVLLTVCNTVVRPCRAKNTSAIVNNDGEYTLLQEKFQTASVVSIGFIGGYFVLTGTPLWINLLCALLLTSASRTCYRLMLTELNNNLPFEKRECLN